MKHNIIEFKPIDFGRLEPNSLYAVKFSDYWSFETSTKITKMLNEYGEYYNIKFVPIYHDMEIVNGEENE